MSGLPSGLSVLRQVPQHLVDGYVAGEYQLWGGVLRRATDTGRGQIVGFLTEGRDLIRQMEQNLPISPQALQAAVGNARMAAQLAAGIGVLNLGVQVAGFAMVMRRLDRIAGQIEAMHADLRRIGEDVAWLRTYQLAELRADAQNAVATAERGARQGNPDSMNRAKTDAGRVRRLLVNLCNEMLVTGRAVGQRVLFEEFVTLWVLLVHTEARCDEAVEGAGQAARDLEASARDLRRLADGFRDQVRNFGRNPMALLKIGDAGRSETKRLRGRVSDLVGRLESYVPQLRLQDALGLGTADWQALVAPGDGGALTCITSETTPLGDLLDAVLANTASAPGRA